MDTYEITYNDGSTELLDAASTSSSSRAVDFYNYGLVLSLSRGAYLSIRKVAPVDSDAKDEQATR